MIFMQLRTGGGIVKTKEPVSSSSSSYCSAADCVNNVEESRV